MQCFGRIWEAGRAVSTERQIARAVSLKGKKLQWRCGGGGGPGALTFATPVIGVCVTWVRSQCPCSVRASTTAGRSAMALPGEAAPAVVAAIALPALFPGAAQVLVERPAAAPVGPHVAVDGLVADAERADAPEIPGDLLRATLPLEVAAHVGEISRGEALVAPRPSAPVRAGSGHNCRRSRGGRTRRGGVAAGGWSRLSPFPAAP